MKLSSLLTLSAVAAIATAAPYPNKSGGTKQDPCSVLGEQQRDNKDFTYEAVTGCYYNVPYNATIANQVLNSLESTIKNFYPFADLANGKHGTPFQTPRVDFDKEFKRLRSTKWKNDYDFHMSLSQLLTSVNDGHLAYYPTCFTAITFTQPFSLYAPVVNGKQVIRVFAVDEANPNAPKDKIVDCEVVEIDGQPAMKAVQEYADKYSGTSRDPAVRLADALGSTSWRGKWAYNVGSWMRRIHVPNKATINYKIKCDKGGIKKYKIPWVMRDYDANFAFGFNDTASYYKTVCESTYLSTSRANRNKIENEAPATMLLERRGALSIPDRPRNAPGHAPSADPITLAELITRTQTTAYYKMKKGNACVAVIYTESFRKYNEYVAFANSVKEMRDLGCKKLIFDMTNNGGGSIEFAYFVNDLFFPTAKPYFEQDLRASNVAKLAAKKALKVNEEYPSILDPRYFVDAKTRKHFTDDSLYTKGTKLTRFGKTSDYTQRNYFEYNKAKNWPVRGKNDTLPWKAKDMAIITNGWCGSACTMIATRFNVNHKVKTYAIGGIHKRPMSYFTFPGGFVYQHDYLADDFADLNITGKDVPKRLPVKNIASFPFGEIYKDGEKTIPLEYDTSVATANVHLDYDLATARHPDLVWAKVAADLKK